LATGTNDIVKSNGVSRGKTMTVRIEDITTRLLDTADGYVARYQRIGHTGQLTVMQVDVGAANFADDGSQ
jgi:hypothetical protein